MSKFEKGNIVLIEYLLVKSVNDPVENIFRSGVVVYPHSGYCSVILFDNGELIGVEDKKISFIEKGGNYLLEKLTN